MNSILKTAMALCLTFSYVSGTAHASIVLSDDVILNGVTYQTFTDTLTNNVWLEWDAFFSMTAIGIDTTLDGTGFSLVSMSAVGSLFDPILDGTTETFDEVVHIASGGDGHGSTTSYLMAGSNSDGSVSQVGMTGHVKHAIGPWYPANWVGAWVMRPGSVASAVPEPSILALMGLGLLGMFGLNRRKVQL